MPIAASDIKVRLTTTSGSAGETVAGSVGTSLGKYASTTDLVDNTVNNLFDDVSGDENAAGTVDYRCVAVLNKHGSLTWQAPKVWIQSEIASGADIALGLDPVGVVASTAIMGTSIANELAAPTGVTFSAPTTKGLGLAPGNVPAGSGFLVWVRRTANNTPAINADGATIAYQGDTAA